MASDDTTSVVRRRFLKRLGAGASVTLLAGCQGTDETTTSTSPATETTAEEGGGDEPTATETTAEESGPTRGGNLVVATPGDPQNMDPHTTTINVAQLVLDNIVEGLFELDANLDVVPMLADGVSISDDNLTYEIPLKQGVTFHTGTELTAADVKYTIDRILDPDLGSPRAANFQKVDTVEAVDDYTVRFTLSEPFAPFLLALAESAGIVPEGAGDEYDLKQNPVGTGPFTLETWETDNQVVISGFDDYHMAEQPYLDQVTFSVTPEAATRLTQLRQGSAHVMFGVPFQRASDIQDGQQTTLQSVSGLWKQAFWFNTDREPFDDARVRRAVSHALNREQFVQGVLFGQGQVAHSPAPPTSVWRDRMEFGEPHTYSQQRAQSLFEEAGVDPANIETTIKASRTPGPTYADTATLAQAMLSRLGMSVEVEIMDFSTWLEQAWVNKDFDLSVGSWSGRIDPDGWYFRQYHSEGAWNRWNYANDEVDSLLEEGRITTDVERRAEIYSQIDQIVSQDAPMVYLYYRKELTGLRDEVNGYQLSPAHQAEFQSTSLEG